MSKSGAVVYVPPAPDDAQDAFVEAAARSYRAHRHGGTLPGGFTLEALRAAEDHEPFLLTRRAVKVCGIRL
ncbi:MAG: hypothetical protein V4593_08215 [Pseudomonadota bacterium]